jgi:hypothetical protein
LHTFISGIDLKRIQELKPPFIPAEGSGFEELPPLSDFTNFQVSESYGENISTDQFFDFEYVEPPQKPGKCRCSKRGFKAQSECGWDDGCDASVDYYLDRQRSLTLKTESPEPISIVADTTFMNNQSRSYLTRFNFNYRPVELPMIFARPKKPAGAYLPSLPSLDMKISTTLPPVLKLAPPLLFRN